MANDSQLSVLVVCLGNICRSPMGHAVLEYEAKKRGLNITVDSAVRRDFPTRNTPRFIHIYANPSLPHTDRERQHTT